MASLMPIEGRVVTTDLQMEAECRLLRAELAAARARETRSLEAAPAPRNNVPWIVCGGAVCLFMVISALWAMGLKLIEVMEAQAARQHETTMAALDVASSAAPAGMDPVSAGVFGALLLVAAIWLIRLCVRGGK